MRRAVWYSLVVLFSIIGNQAIADAVLLVSEEAKQEQQTQDEDPFVAESGASNSQWELIHQVDLLQQEVQMLRGLVEQQSHQLERAQKTERNRYIDLDRRLSELQESYNGLQQSLTEIATAKEKAPAPTPAPQQVYLPSEKELYDKSQGYVQSRKFDLAIVSFQDLLAKYPEGEYAPYAHYWLGEVYMALDTPLLDDAKGHFNIVLKTYPKHPKIPATLFKLGKLWDQLGDQQQASTYFDRVIAEFPGSSSASLADRYKQKWQKAGPQG